MKVYADNLQLARMAGLTSILAALLMITGAGFNGASGTDLWAALANDQMAPYLEAIGKVKTLLIINLSFWIIGVMVMGWAGNLMAGLGNKRPVWNKAALTAYGISVPLAIVAFLAMFTIVIIMGGETSEIAVFTADVLGWLGARADDIATALIIGAGPFFLALAGRGEWMPNWLVVWGYVAGLAGLIAVAVLFIPALFALGFIILPIGLGWMIATGIVLMRTPSNRK